MINSLRSIHWPARTAIVLACLLAISFAVIAHQTVEADVSNYQRIGMRVLIKNVDGAWVTNWDGPGWITRNLIDGNPIPVCSDDYPTATQGAIHRWNTALGIEAFAMAESCVTENMEVGSWDPSEGIVGVTVSRGTWISTDKNNITIYEGKLETTRDGEAKLVTCTSYGGCAGAEERGQNYTEGIEDWRSYHGRAEVVMNPVTHPTDGESAGLLRAITHELGHIIALADYFCGLADVEHPDYLLPGTKSLMNSWTIVGTRPNDPPSCDLPGGKPTELDKRDYRTAYLPATVTRVAGGANDQLVTLTWDPSNVFVESGFEIQRKNGDAWEKVATVGPNASFVDFSGEQAEEHHYRVVSRTMALPIKETDTDFGYSDDETASDVVSVTVKMSRPANPDVTGRSTTSLTLVWVEVDAADGYDVRYDVRIIETARIDCEAPPDEEEMVRGSPYTFTGLSASTAYLLCVRATLSSNPDASSNWASISRTTQAPPQPQPAAATAADGG